MNPTGAGATPPALPRDPIYFFLSYAHSPPMLEDPRLDPDHWVKVFFNDLSEEVRRLIGVAGAPQVGFFDGNLPMGADWKASLADALGATQVFVPLYSPAYFSNSWPIGELESFRKRLKASRQAGQYRHVRPVLWIPLPSWDQNAETREALEFASDIAAYADNGLRALCMLSAYHRQYDEILRRIAAEILDVARHHPLLPSAAPRVDEMSRLSPDDAQFIVVIAAPTTADLPPGRDASPYATSSELWRPFRREQALPAANYVASTAERLGLATRITDVTDVADALASRPAVILIDPWILDGAAGEYELASVLKRLPQWVIPLVVVDSGDPQNAGRGGRLAERFADMLKAAGRPRAKQVGHLPEFVQVMPELVTEARRQYLKNAPVFPPDRPRTPRRRLSGGDVQ